MSPSHVIIAILILALTAVSVRAFLFSPLNTSPNRSGGNPNTHASGGLSQNTPTDLVSPSPTSSPVQSGTVLCNYHWTNGMDGWSGNANWKQVNNMLVDDGTDPNGEFQDSVAFAPCQPTTDNYSIEATIQYVKNGGGFGILGRAGDQNSGVGDKAWITTGATPPYHNMAAITRATQSPVNDFEDLAQSLAFKDNYQIGTSWHTYRFDLTETPTDVILTFFIDGEQILTTTDAIYSGPDRVGLVVDNNSQINIKSFQVTVFNNVCQLCS